MKMSYEVNQKVYVTVAETSVIGGVDIGGLSRI